MATNRDVAEWMVSQLDKLPELYQEDAAFRIMAKFGKEFVYDNENGNPAINRDVLNLFRKLTAETVVWERGTRLWRKRAKLDEPGRRQD